MSADINSVSNDSHIDQDLTTDNDLHEKHLSDSDDSDSSFAGFLPGDLL